MVRIATLKAIAQRFSFLLLLIAAVGIMMLGKVDTVLVDGLRARVTDAFSPILDAFSRPAATVAGVLETISELTQLREENARLRAENEALRQFEAAAFSLEAENATLREQLNFQPDYVLSFLTARVIADNSGAFVRSVGINLGTHNGLHDGLAALGARGLVGRTVQTGERSSRVLLLTDLNARVPVVIESSRRRAMLGGDNSEEPLLLYLPPDSEPKVGDRIVTSGHGGMFPPGLPVGTVSAVEGAVVRVRPFEDLSRLDQVRIVEFTLATEEVRLTPGGPR
jgi:rod shape-determining protein MreC